VRSFTFALAALALCGLDNPGARAQTKETPPAGPVVIRTDLANGWYLEIVVNATTTSSSVRYTFSGFLESVRASVGVKECERMAEAIDAAAAAVRADKRFETERFGDVTITTGTGKIGVVGKDGKYTAEDRKCVMLRGGETGLFSKPLETNLLPDEAEKFAKSIRTAPGIHARLKAAIDFDAIYKTK